MTSKIDSIHRIVSFNASIEDVWRAITEPDEVRKWFGSDAQYELTPGAIGYFEWQQECEGRFAVRIDTIEPPRYFAWRWMLDADTTFDEQSSTLVEWTLTELPTGGTQLEMLESGFVTAHHRQMNVEGWQQELDDLVAYVNA